MARTATHTVLEPLPQQDQPGSVPASPRMDRVGVAREPGRQDRRHRGGNRRASSPPGPSRLPEVRSHRAADRARRGALPGCCRHHSLVAKLRHHRDEHRRIIGRQAQQTGSRRLAPGEQVPHRDAVLARHPRHDGAGRIGFRDDWSLDFVTPATPTPSPHMDIDPAPWLRSLEYGTTTYATPHLNVGRIVLAK
jgi:hypothetical protein